MGVMFEEYKCVINVSFIEDRSEKVWTVIKQVDFMKSHKNVSESGTEGETHA